MSGLLRGQLLKQWATFATTLATVASCWACRGLVVFHSNCTTDPCQSWWIQGSFWLFNSISYIYIYIYIPFLEIEEDRGVFHALCWGSVQLSGRCREQVCLHDTPTSLTRPLNHRVQVHTTMSGMWKSWAAAHIQARLTHTLHLWPATTTSGSQRFIVNSVLQLSDCETRPK